MPEADGAFHEECTVNLDADGIDAFHRFLTRSWERVESCTPVEPDWEFAFSLMLGELVANISQHAYEGMPEHCRWLRVCLDVVPPCVSGEVRDRGRPFENAGERLGNARLDDGETAEESGRGLRILTTLADSIEYDRTDAGENIWRVTKCMGCSLGDHASQNPGTVEDAG
jgi:anti-sigma regulatory factor (Ser/Thr protein kinase)